MKFYECTMRVFDCEGISPRPKIICAESTQKAVIKFLEQLEMETEGVNDEHDFGPFEVSCFPRRAAFFVSDL